MGARRCDWLLLFALRLVQMLMKARMLVTTARAMSRLDSTSVSILRCKICFLFEGWLSGRKTFWGTAKPSIYEERLEEAFRERSRSPVKKC